MRVLVCGGRDFKDNALLEKAIDRLFEKYGDDLVIVHGACPEGADKLAEDWAKSRQVRYMGFPARWKAQGKKAGPLRNARMLSEALPDACVAFPGGSGTADMCSRCESAGLSIWKVKP